jgi:hypothetical protein
MRSSFNLSWEDKYEPIFRKGGSKGSWGDVLRADEQWKEGWRITLEVKSPFSLAMTVPVKVSIVP